MSNITQLTDKQGNNIYPVTSDKVVMDENGLSVHDKITVLNTSKRDKTVKINMDDLGEDVKGAITGDAEISLKAYNPNAIVPLNIPSYYEGLGQCTHPKVLYFENKWNGYFYWMAFTPYPYGQMPHENPCIAVSNDGVKWEVPNGLSNPIDTPIDGYMSDTHLVYREDTNVLECWYRFVKTGNTGEIIYRKTSSNGTSWSDREELFKIDGGAGSLLSPCVIFENSTYKIWVSVNGSLKYYESSNGDNWVFARTINIACWHMDIIKSDLGYEMVTYIQNPNKLVYHYSADNVTWSNGEVILEPIPNSWDSGLYRSSIVKQDDRYLLYYAGTGSDGKGTQKAWRVGLSVSNGLDVSTFEGMKTDYSMNKFPTTDIALNYKGSFGYNKTLNVMPLFSGTQSERESIEYNVYPVGTIFFDRTLNKPCWLKNNLSMTWVDASGTEIPKSNISVISVSLNKPTTTVPKGSTETLVATVLPAEATNKNVTWSSSNTSVATVNNGVVSGVSNGSCVITVTTVDGNKTATCNVTVETVTMPVESVSIKSEHTFKVDETVQLTATITPSNASNKNITWTSSDTTKATVVNGLVTAKAEGNATITVTTEDGNKTATCLLTIQAKSDAEQITDYVVFIDGSKNCYVDKSTNSKGDLIIPNSVTSNSNAKFVLRNTNGSGTYDSIATKTKSDNTAWYNTEVEYSFATGIQGVVETTDLYLLAYSNYTVVVDFNYITARTTTDFLLTLYGSSIDSSNQLVHIRRIADGHINVTGNGINKDLTTVFLATGKNRIVVRRDGSTIDVFMGGAKITSITEYSNTSNIKGVGIGYSDYNKTTEWNNVKLWNRSLTDSEISNL